MKKWYEEIFENFAEGYEKESFTQGTIGETDFLEIELGNDKTKKILDIGCGTGRHSLELARRGYRNITGVDLSESMLNKAITSAGKESLEIRFLKMNAMEMDFKGEFDMAMILCEGAFSLMETDEMNFKILENMSRALKPGGKFILTTLSALYPLTHSMEEFENMGVSNFDILTFRNSFEYKIADDSGTERLISGTERYYTPPEINWLLRELGFKKIEIFGATLGAFSRNDKFTNEDFEMLVIAEK